MPQGLLEATADLGLSKETQAHLVKAFQIARISFDEAQAQAAKTKERATRVAQIERGSAFLQFEALMITEWPAEQHDMLAEHISRHASLERPVCVMPDQ